MGVAFTLTFLIFLMLFFAIGLTVIIMLQSGRSAGLSGAISGGAESIFGKKKGLDDFLSKLSVVFAGGFFLIGLIIAFIERS